MLLLLSYKLFMEYNIKKKSKNGIHIKTSKLISDKSFKQAFFEELLTTLKREFDQESFAFLATCRIYEDNPLKKCKTQQKLNTITKIVTQPDQRACNINDIDPNIFHQDFTPKNTLKIYHLNQNHSQNNIFQKKPSVTPRSRFKKQIFSNNKILNFDKKLDKKYYQQTSTRFSDAPSQKISLSTRGHFFIPKFQEVLSSTNRNRTSSGHYRERLKLAIRKFSKKKTVTTNDMKIRRLQTSFGPKQYEEIKEHNDFSFRNFRQSSIDFKDLTRRSEIIKKLNFTQMLKTTEGDSVPKQFMDQMLFSKRQAKHKQLCRDSTEYKRRSPVFRDTFLC